MASNLLLGGRIHLSLLLRTAVRKPVEGRAEGYIFKILIVTRLSDESSSKATATVWLAVVVLALIGVVALAAQLLVLVFPAPVVCKPPTKHSKSMCICCIWLLAVASVS